MSDLDELRPDFAAADFYAALHSAREKIARPAVRHCRAHTLEESEIEVIEFALSFLSRALRNMRNRDGAWRSTEKTANAGLPTDANSR